MSSAKLHLSDEGWKATSTALDSATDAAGVHSEDPKAHIHRPADHAGSHAWLSKLLPSATVKHLENNYHLGNYVADRQTGEKSWESMSVYVRLGMHLLYYGSYQENLLQWPSTVHLLAEQSEKMGKKYDDPASKAHIQPFIESFGLGPSLSDLAEPDPTKYPTFNAFFGRAIRPDARPVAEPTNDMVTVSPADCRMTAFPTIDIATKYWVKGLGFILEHLLGDKDLASQLEGGSMVIARLAPQDYHRWHAPISGVVQSVKDIPGAYYTVNPQAINEPGTLDVYCANKRSVMVVKRNPTEKSVVLIAVGAMLVGSIKYVDGCDKPGSRIQKGQCLGSFYYGGSTVLVLYPRGEVSLDKDLVARSTDSSGPCETLMRVGWHVGGPASS